MPAPDVHKPKPERNAEIYKRRLTGETYRNIASDIGISIPNVRRVFLRELRRHKEKIR